MRIPLIFRVAAPFLLVIFTFTSCSGPFLRVKSEAEYEPKLDSEPEQEPPITIHTVPVGKGDPRIVYLDDNYQPTVKDSGRMALYVENNELTRNVLVLGEIRDNHIDNDVVTRIINNENNSLISMFYHTTQNFPYKIAISIEGEDVTGEFSLYDWDNETYSVKFLYEDDSELFENLILNKNVFDICEPIKDLTETQNARLQNIIITLALYNSLSFQIDDDDLDSNARGLFKRIKNALTIALAVVAIIAIAVVVIVAPPAGIAITGVAIAAAITTTTGAVAAGVAVAASAAAVIIKMIPDEDEFKKTIKDGPQATPGSNPLASPRVHVSIKEVVKNIGTNVFQTFGIGYKINMYGQNIKIGQVVENDSAPYYLQEKRESITFNLDFDYLPENNLGKVIYLNESILQSFNPKADEDNTIFFEPAEVSIGSRSVQIKLTRKITGHVGDGALQYIVPFLDNNIIINPNTDSETKEVSFPGEPGRKVFIFNFTTVAPNEG